jgi:hypothetical protein
VDECENARVFFSSIHLSIIQSSSLFVAAGRGLNKKPTTVSSRGFLSKFYLTTSADGVVSYNDDYQSDLSNTV